MSELLFIFSGLSFLLTFLITNKFIKIFLIHQLIQTVREEGPKAHYKKNGTPTMGGVIFVSVTTILFLLYIFISKIDVHIYEVILIVFPFISYSIIGFIDDKLKIKNKKNDGLSAKSKFILQIIVSVIFYIIYLELGLDTFINFFDKKIDIKYLYGILILLMFTGSSNATNLTDGIDGLLSGIMIIILFFLGIISIKEKHDIAFIFIILLGFSLLGFYIFNLNPAQIFMGDAGSLALGAAISALSIVLNLELLLLIFGLPFIIETLSVIIQVIYFKITKGKRLFKMAPIHHHLELIGIDEKKICIIFYVLAIISCIIALLIY